MCCDEIRLMPACDDLPNLPWEIGMAQMVRSG